jgi:hypothetical protein
MKTAFVITNPFAILYDKLIAYREEKFAEKCRRINARNNTKMVRYAMKHSDDETFVKEDTYDAIQAATDAIGYYEDMQFCERSNEVFGTSTVIGKIMWGITLALVEFLCVFAGMAIMAGIFGPDALTFWTIAPMLLAVAIPLDIMGSKSMLLKPFLKLRIRRLRACRDELEEAC